MVESYWVGGPLLERVPSRLLAANLDDRFARRAGRHSAELEALAMLGGRAHHNFHVFAVYPWVGMLRAGYAEEPLRVLNSCRVRWGTVLEVDGAGGAHGAQQSTVLGRARAAPGRPADERVRGGPRLAVGVGDRVALHWDWLCDVLDARRLGHLRHYTTTQLELVNERSTGRSRRRSSTEAVSRPPVRVLVPMSRIEARGTESTQATRMR